MAGTGAGKRPHTDFVTGGTAMNQPRRRGYLTGVTDLLLADLHPGARCLGPLHRPATTPPPSAPSAAADSPHKDARKDAMADIIRGLGSLARAELSGERMTVAYKNRDQEDEHSCFSDSTWLDLHGNAKGIRNVWTGSYEGQDLGPGLEDVVKAADPALATRVGKDIDEAVATMKTLADGNQQAPFDVVIAEPDGSANRTTMLDAMKALKRVADGLSAAASALGLQVAFEKPSMEL